METIGKQEIWSFSAGAKKAEVRECLVVRSTLPHRVSSYLELAKKVAELQFRNRDHVLMFRGQAREYLNTHGRTTLKPSLLRPVAGKNPSLAQLDQRFTSLERAEQLLVVSYREGKFKGLVRLQRYQILRWAILQHYEVCATPLLDVTHSLRIAASFASNDGNDEAFLFVLGIPNLSGAVTASAEAGLQIVRLSSVCPPSALRPHIQEGYLLGEYPDMSRIEQKKLYQHFEIDFGRRLVAKFRFNPNTFWKDDAFQKVGSAALYPSSKQDPLRRMTEKIKIQLPEGR